MATLYIPTAIHGPSHARPKTLDQFESRQEVLFALRDAVVENQAKWNASQVAHGNISINTICIGDIKSAGARGFLINPEYSTKPNGNYLDDLESFYFVIAYICITFTAPHTCHSNLPRTVLVWAANPQSEESALAKRAIILGSGVEYSHVQPYFGTFIFGTLLEGFHTILKCRNEKRASRTVTKEMLRTESDEDYANFLERLNWAIGVMEDLGDRQIDKIDTQMTTFKVNQF